MVPDRFWMTSRRYLVTIIPPAHDSSVLWSVLPQPIVGFPEVIQNLSGTIISIACKHNAGTGIGITGYPGAVHSKHHQKHQHSHHHDGANVDAKTIIATTSLLMFHLPDLSSFVIQATVLLICLRIFIFGSLIFFKVNGEQFGEGNGGKYANTRCEGEHESDHDSCKVDSSDSIKNDEDSLIIHILDAIPQSNRKDTSKNVEIKEEAEPGGRLMFRNRGNDGNVNLSIACVPQ